MEISNIKQNISLDGPPLDFTYKSIEFLDTLKTIEPRSGKRKPIIELPSRNDKKNQGIMELNQQLQDKNQKDAQNEQNDQLNDSQEQKEQEKDNEEKNENEEKNNEKEQQKKKAEKEFEIIRAIPQTNALNVQNIIMNNNVTASSNIIKNNQGGGMYNQSEKQVIRVKVISTSLFLSYNLIPSIAGFYNIIDSVMYDCKNLRWIDLSHNKLTKLDYNFEDFPYLTTLYLHCNQLCELNDLLNLTKLQYLRTLTIHGQPIEQIPSFRLYIIGILPQLKKLDTVLISEKEKDNTQVLVNCFKKVKFPKPQSQIQQATKSKAQLDSQTKQASNKKKS